MGCCVGPCNIKPAVILHCCKDQVELSDGCGLKDAKERGDNVLGRAVDVCKATEPTTKERNSTINILDLVRCKGHGGHLSNEGSGCSLNHGCNNLEGVPEEG